MKMSLESLASISRKTGFSYFALLGTCSLWGGACIGCNAIWPTRDHHRCHPVRWHGKRDRQPHSAAFPNQNRAWRGAKSICPK